MFINIVEKITSITGYICAFNVILMMLIVLYEAIMRYFFHNAPMIADEISCYMLVFVVFIGLAYTWKEKMHVRINIFIIRMSNHWAHRLRLITLTIGFVCIVILTKLGYSYVVRTHKMHIRSSYFYAES